MRDSLQKECIIIDNKHREPPKSEKGNLMLLYDKVTLSYRRLEISQAVPKEEAFFSFFRLKAGKYPEAGGFHPFQIFRFVHSL